MKELNRELVCMLLIITLVVMLADCRKELTDWNPNVALVVKPDSGLTTQTFDLAVDINNLPKDQSEFYIRWDLNGDSVWDAPFSALPSITHRFYHQGIQSVKVEVLTKDGKQLVLGKKIHVNQGYSAPHTAFTISPSTGHYRTDFVFDASSTFDDEDAFESLQFKWDFDNDGYWDTASGNVPISRHTFQRAGTYTVKLCVTDPSQRMSTLTKALVVTMVDSLIHPDFTWTPTEATVKDTIRLDASATHDDSDSTRFFTYSWSIQGEVGYGPFTDPVFPHQFWKEGTQKVTLTATDLNGLYNSITKEIYLYKENRPPIPAIQVPAVYGNIVTNFFFSAWPSRDDVTPPSRLLIRWDFDGDGSWDTGWSYEKTIYHQFGMPGTFQVALQAKDEGGAMANAYIEIQVSSSTNPTGFILDKRDNRYYGTVKIGEQWWMSDNLDYRFEPKAMPPLLRQCFDEKEEECDQYGSLYYGERSVAYVNAGKKICPEGWRIPTKADWDLLYQQVPRTGGRAALMAGGSLGFNAKYTGYASYAIVLNDFDKPKDTIWEFIGLDKDVKFLSQTTRPFLYRNQTQSIMWLRKNFDGMDVWWDDPDCFYYIRCIKE